MFQTPMITLQYVQGVGTFSAPYLHLQNKLVTMQISAHYLLQYKTMHLVAREANNSERTIASIPAQQFIQQDFNSEKRVATITVPMQPTLPKQMIQLFAHLETGMSSTAVHFVTEYCMFASQLEARANFLLQQAQPLLVQILQNETKYANQIAKYLHSIKDTQWFVDTMSAHPEYNKNQFTICNDTMQLSAVSLFCIQYNTASGKLIRTDSKEQVVAPNATFSYDTSKCTGLETYDAIHLYLIMVQQDNQCTIEKRIVFMNYENKWRTIGYL